MCALTDSLISKPLFVISTSIFGAPLCCVIPITCQKDSFSLSAQLSCLSLCKIALQNVLPELLPYFVFPYSKHWDQVAGFLSYDGCFSNNMQTWIVKYVAFHGHVYAYVHVCIWAENLEAVFLLQHVQTDSPRATMEASILEGECPHVLFHWNRAEGSMHEFLEKLWISSARIFVK